MKKSTLWISIFLFIFGITGTFVVSAQTETPPVQFLEKSNTGTSTCTPNTEKGGFDITGANGEITWSKYCVEFQEAVPFGDKKIIGVTGNTGVEVAANYLSLIYKFGALLIGLVSVLVIVISGVEIMSGGVSPEAVTSAKNRIMQALLSIAILLASAMILRTINPGFFT